MTSDVNRAVGIESHRTGIAADGDVTDDGIGGGVDNTDRGRAQIADVGVVAVGSKRDP